MRRISLTLLAVVSAACASAPVRPQDQVWLDRAAGWVSDGCYDCLLEARETYTRLAVGRARPLVLPRLLETELLIALRERELAIDSAEAEARALALAPELAAVLDVPRIMALVRLMAPEPSGTPRSVARDQSRLSTVNVQLRTLRTDAEWLMTSPLGEPARSYLALSLHCARQSQAPYPPGLLPYDDLRGWPASVPPLLVYRAAICTRIDLPVLERIRSEVPRFVEAGYRAARIVVANVQQRGNVGEARDQVESLYARFAHSPAITYLYGSFNQLIGDSKAALRYYEETLAIQPRHEDAMLGRTVAFTFLRQDDEAIAAATHMIDLATDNRADAFYWRAWNRWSRKELVLARADVEAAKALRSNPDLHTLAGQIEHDQVDLDPAEADLRTAVDMSAGKGNCTADWYLGLVLMKRERWAETAGSFENAMNCYRVRVAASETALAAVRAREDLDPDYRARQIVGFEAAIIEDRSQYHAAAFNAANHFARAGDPDKARVLVEIAAVDPALADLVRQLRAILK
ncbi:MAG TPA: hypothetical protein VMM93_10995 [Vicinamibacterales bacterium]|nr:hypothetical protein [Vicinamibacterales bacterium]